MTSIILRRVITVFLTCLGFGAGIRLQAESTCCAGTLEIWAATKSASACKQYFEQFTSVPKPTYYLQKTTEYRHKNTATTNYAATPNVAECDDPDRDYQANPCRSNYSEDYELTLTLTQTYSLQTGTVSQSGSGQYKVNGTVKATYQNGAWSGELATGAATLVSELDTEAQAGTPGTRVILATTDNYDLLDDPPQATEPGCCTKTYDTYKNRYRHITLSTPDTRNIKNEAFKAAAPNTSLATLITADVCSSSTFTDSTERCADATRAAYRARLKGEDKKRYEITFVLYQQSNPKKRTEVYENIRGRGLTQYADGSWKTVPQGWCLSAKETKFECKDK